MLGLAWAALSTAAKLAVKSRQIATMSESKYTGFYLAIARSRSREDQAEH
jgi:hypothetical protein